MSEQFIPAKGATAYVDYYRNNHPEHSLFSADNRVGRKRIASVNSKSSTSNANRPRSSSVGRFKVASPPLVSNGEPSVNQQQGLRQNESSNSGSSDAFASIPVRKGRFSRNRHSSGKAISNKATLSQPTNANELFAYYALGLEKAKAHIFDGCLAKSDVVVKVEQSDVVVKVEPVSPPKQQNQVEPAADFAPTESAMYSGNVASLQPPPRSVSVTRSDSIQNSPYSSPIKEPVITATPFKVPRNPVPASILRQYRSPRACSFTPIFRPRLASNFPLSPTSKPCDETFEFATTSDNVAELDQFLKTGKSNTEQTDDDQQLIDEAMKQVGRAIPKPELLKVSPGKGILDRGIVTCAEHFNKLFIRLSQDKKTVINFEDNLNNHYEQYNSQKQPIVPDILQVGAYYVGKAVTLSPQFFRHHWCRCLLLKIKKETAVVQLIDYGRVVELKLNAFHPLQPAFRDQPVMCIGPCTVAGVATAEHWENVTTILIPLNAVVSAYLTVDVDGSLIVNIYKHEKGSKVVTHINWL